MSDVSNYYANNMAWKEVLEPEVTKICPTCEGSGLDKWEEDDCDRCWGQGEF